MRLRVGTGADLAASGGHRSLAFCHFRPKLSRTSDHTPVIALSTVALAGVVGIVRVFTSLISEGEATRNGNAHYADQLSQKMIRCGSSSNLQPVGVMLLTYC